MSGSITRKLFAHGAVYSLARFLNQVISILFIPLYAHFVGDQGFGIISLMATFGAFLSMLMLQGLHGSWFRLRFDYQDESDKRMFETTIIWYLAASGAAFIVLLSLFGDSVSHWATPGVSYYPLGLLTAAGAFALVFVQLYERKLQAEQRPGRLAWFSLIRAALTAGAILLAVGVFHYGATGKIFSETLALVVIAIVALILLRPGSPRIGRRAMLTRSLAYGFPLIPHNIAGLINDMIDRILLSSMLGLALQGIYSMGYLLASAALMVATALNQAFSPLFISTMKEIEKKDGQVTPDQRRELINHLRHSARMLVVAVAIVAAALAAVAREVLLVLTTAEFREAWSVVAPVCAGIIAWSCYFVFAQAIFYDLARVRLIPIVTIVAAVINIGGNLLLIPLFGIMGAAAATFASSCVMAALAWWLGHRVIDLLGQPGPWLQLAVLTIIVLTGCWVADSNLQSLALRLSSKLLLFGAFVVALVRTSGITLRRFREMLSRSVETSLR